MRANDAFRNELHSTIRGLRTWADSLNGVAEVDISEADDHWRLNLVPHGTAACPVELVLYSDQRYDCAIGSETYEDQPATDLASLLPLLQAIVDGRLVTRSWTTVATGAHLATATIVNTPGGPWMREHVNATLERIADRDAAAVRDRHYAPYARVGLA